MTQATGSELAVRESAADLAGFEESAGAVGQLATQAGTASAVAREEAELKAAIVLARRFPRDEAAAYTKIIKSCQRPGFAEGCAYCFPRGGQNVKGPSVDLAREMARCWGNIRYGQRIVSLDEDHVHIKGYAYDCETNNYIEAEDKFEKLVQRKRGGQTQWVKPDERDLRELVNRRGAICVRNAILQVMPPDVVDDAVRQADETMRKAAAGDIKQDREGALRRLALAFSELGVNTDMIATKLGHPLELITDDELATLRQVFKSVRDGNSKREDHFDIPSANGHSAKAESVNAKIEGIQGENRPATPEEEERRRKATEAVEAAKAKAAECAPGKPGCSTDPSDFSTVEGKRVCAKHALMEKAAAAPRQQRHPAAQTEATADAATGKGKGKAKVSEPALIEDGIG